MRNISKKYGANEVLRDINLDIEEGEFVCLLGPSGCGKTTLLRLLAGLDTPTGGQIELSGKDATYIPASKRNFGIVFQSYALFPNLNAYENIAYGLRNKKIPSKNIDEIVDNLFKMIDLSDAKLRYPAQLSGGEQQRVALARALASRPDFLLLDEPLSALDAKVRLSLRREIRRIQNTLNITTVMVTHDQEEALTMADRIIVMNKSEIVQSGAPQDVYEKPVNRFVADFVGSINFIDNESRTYAVRPENVRLSLERGEDKLRAVLSDVEFRGSFMRVFAKTSQINRSGSFIIDVPLKDAKQLDLMVNKAVYISLPSESLINITA
jgi:iron(III) transport system ATP-binding protein